MIYGPNGVLIELSDFPKRWDMKSEILKMVMSLSIGNDNGMKSFDENMRNRLVNSLKKVKLSKKLKLYDTYKNKEDEEENINNVTDYSSIMNLKKNQNENKKSPIKKKK